MDTDGLKIIDSQSEFSALLDELDQEQHVPLVYSIPASFTMHPQNTNLSACFIYVPTTDILYVLLIDHHEHIWGTIEHVEQVINRRKMVLYDSKLLRHFINIDTCHDYKMYRFFRTNKPVGGQHELYRNLYKNMPVKLNSAIPVSMLVSIAVDVMTDMYTFISDDTSILTSDSYATYVNKILPVFQRIESEGLAVGEDYRHGSFPNGKKAYVDGDGLVYTHYNFYTQTGRPSNAWSKVNYAALAPEERIPYVSRFDNNGLLISMDYDAFHLRLLGKLMRYNLPSESFHNYLGRIYFETDELTEEQYTESKKISFTLLYHPTDIPDDLIEGNDYFKMARDFTTKLWHLARNKGHIVTPIFKRKISNEHIGDINPSKILNYVLQSMETEWNVYVLENIQQYLSDKKSCLCLYTYDSVLIDWCGDDGVEVLEHVQKLMGANDMKIKVETGENYGQMLPLDS